EASHPCQWRRPARARSSSARTSRGRARSGRRSRAWGQVGDALSWAADAAGGPRIGRATVRAAARSSPSRRRLRPALAGAVAGQPEPTANDLARWFQEQDGHTSTTYTARRRRPLASLATSPFLVM